MKRLVLPSKFHQEGGRVAEATSWVRMSSGNEYTVFFDVTLQNVGCGGLLGLRNGSSGSNGEDIYGSSGGKECISGREDICGCGGRGDVSGGSSCFTSRGSLSAFSQSRLEGGKEAI